mgnify:CR=1 FL=1
MLSKTIGPAGARLLEILSREADPSRRLNALPDSTTTPELQLKTAEGENFTLVEKLRNEAKFERATEVITIDGVRAEYPDGFGLARPSNTTPVVVLRFEADDEAALARGFDRLDSDFARYGLRHSRVINAHFAEVSFRAIPHFLKRGADVRR